MTTTIHINGMSCNHCVQAFSKALQDLPGVEKIEVHLNAGTAILEHTEPLDMDAVQDRVEKAGYELA